MTDDPSPQEGRPREDAVLARAEAEVGAASAAAFLRRFAGLPRGFWEREGRWSAWAGAAARLEVPRGRGGAFAEIREGGSRLFGRLEGGSPDGPSRPRLYGAFAFDPTRGPGDASGGALPSAGAPPADVPGALFVLPAVELRGGARPPRLAVTAEAPAGTDPAEARAAAGRALERIRSVLAGLSSPPASGGATAGRGASVPHVREVRRVPGREGWRRVVEAALEELSSGRLEKVVTARSLELVLDGPVDAAGVLEALRTGGPGTFPYLLEPLAGTFLAGAAPEIVAAREGRSFHATAVAGTVREGEDPAESERLARRLLSSEKDRREHRIGVLDMRESLQEVAGVAEVDEEPRVLRLQGMQHLLTNLSARVPEDLHVLDLLAALHPTAAVNGRPREAALRFLRRREPFDRGWYAGPVGWFDAAGDGVFAPALRAVTAAGARARICAGAGIVEGSRPEPEWDETGVKLRPGLRALGLEGTAADRAAEVDAAAASGTPGAGVAPAGGSGG